MKLILSTIFGGIVLFLLGWMFYGAIFPSYFAEQFKQIGRTPDDFKMWSIILANFLQAFLMAFIYTKWHKGGSGFKEGLMFGFYIGLLYSVPAIFYFWSRYAATWKAVVLDGVIVFIMTLICGMVIGLTYGKKDTAV